MNYRHAFHAGNFADVIKHAILARVLTHLRQKPAPFRVIDTHAGAGLYDLSGPEAQRSGEWRDGIGRLEQYELSAQARELLQPYRDAVAAANASGGPPRYPGSPVIARYFLRSDDRLLACELEPDAAALLALAMRGDPRVKTNLIDGWTALTAFVPPKERRGLVLIDPPFEAHDEFETLAARLLAAWRKWPTGIYLVWYPVKDLRLTGGFVRKLTEAGLEKTLQTESWIAPPQPSGPLHGTGMLIVNPPWTLESELRVLLPVFDDLFARRPGSGHRLAWLGES